MSAIGYTSGDPHKQDVVSVKAFGAVGDGVTDDTAAITNAIASLPTRGGSVYFPVGDYLITSALTMRSDLILRGEGQDKTYIRQQSTGQDCLTGTDIAYLSLRDLQLYGPGSGTGVGLNLGRSAADNTAKISMRDVVIYNFGSHGLSISNPILTVLDGVSCISNGGHGFDLHGVDAGAAGTSVTLTGCYGNANDQAGFNLRKMAYCAMSGCAADQNGIGFLLVASQGIALNGCGCEGPVNKSVSYPGIGYKVDSSAGVALIGTWLSGNLGTGWWVTNASAAVQLVAPVESAPTGSASAAVKVDSGCKAVMIDETAVTANSLAAGTTSILHNSSGDAVLSGNLNAADGAQLRARSSDGTQQVFMYHTGTFGQIESTTGFVLYNDTTNTAIVGTASPQLKVQYGGGSFHSVDIYHDDSNGKVSTNAGNLQIEPASGSNITTSQDIEVTASAKGLILHDRSNGSKYRLKMTAGTLGVEVVP